MRIFPKISISLASVFIALALCATAPAGAQILFEADWGSGNIYEFAPTGARTTFISGLDQAVALAFDSSSNLFVANGYTGNITEIRTDGTQTNFASGLSYPFGLAFDVFGHLFEADLGSGNIYEFASNGVKSTFVSGFGRPCSLAIDSAGNLFVADQLSRGQSSGSIYKIAPNGVQTTIVSGIIEPNGMAFDRAGNLFVAGEFDGDIYEFTPEGSQSIFASGLDHPSGLAFDNAGNLFVGDEGDGNIYKFRPDGTQSLFATGLNIANGLAFLRSPGTLAPRTLRVPNDYPTIQQAIDEASFFVTDTVLVTNGVYYENLDFDGKAVTVASVNGPQVTVIDGGAGAAVVNVGSREDTNTWLTGFTLTNATSGVNISLSSPTITSNIIVNCGTGIYCYAGSPIILDNLFTNNFGSAVYFFDTITPLFAGNVLTANQGGGINMYVAGSPTIMDNLIQNNIGDGIYMDGPSDPDIIQNVIVGNSGYGINALVPASDRGPFIVNNTIVNNTNSGVFEDGYPAGSEIMNNIIVGTPAITMTPWYGSSPAIIQCNDFYSLTGGMVYDGDIITNLTGMNGNISSNPWFACEPDGDFHLLAGSPCIDAGTNGASDLPAVDFEGNPRILAGNSNNPPLVDMGAFEFNPLYPPVPCLFINCQTDIVVYTFPGQNSAVVNYPTPDATPSATVVCLPPSGSSFYGGTNVVTCTAVYGTNSVACSFNVIVVAAPTITRQPQNVQVSAGQNFILSVGVVGTPPVGYQWNYQGNAIAGANSNTLSITDAQAANDGVYSAFVYNDAGATNSSLARVRVLPAKPTVVTNPAPLTVSASSDAVFNVVATGSEPLAYQWFWNHRAIAGATSVQLILTNVQSANVGDYSVTVSNFSGLATSKNALLSVRPLAPYFDVEPLSTTVLSGSTITLNSHASGSQPIQYQWYLQGHELRNQTRPQLTLSSVSPGMAGSYSVIAKNPYGRAVSSTARLTVNVPPQLVRGLANQIVNAGQNVTLSVVATGAAPLNYSWTFNGSPISWTNSVLNLTNIQSPQAGYYVVTVSNLYGNLSSQAKVSLTGPSARLVAWGDNTEGQVQVSAGLSNIVAVAGGDFHSIALRANGTLLAWGSNSDGQRNIPAHLPRIVSIAAGASHNLAIGEDGSMFAWGNNDRGQCSIPPSTNAPLPVGSGGIDVIWPVSPVNQPVSVSAGDAHSLALMANGTVAAWGDDTYWQTRVPTVLTPEYIVRGWWGTFYYQNPSWIPASAIAAGRNHNLAVLTNGTVIAWGDNSGGQCNVPGDLTNAVAVAGGYLHSVALRADGTVTTWGDNTYGQTNLPPGLTNVVAITAGDFNTLALRADGRVLAWGDNSYGQNNIPASVTNSVGIASGYYHSMALIPVAGKR